MDERKRTFDAGVNEQSQEQGINEHPKRFRPEDILGSNRDDPNKVITRLVVNKQQFSKLIGKQGQMITHIRSITGINVRGTDLDEDHRLVLIVGNLPQVLKCFDLISEIIHTTTAVPILHNNLQSFASQDTVSILYMLLEHSKAGKAVGTKGTMLQTLKRKSGAISIRIEKEPLDYAGVSLRKLSIEGSLLSIRRAHYFILELYFTDISHLSLTSSAVFNQRLAITRPEENHLTILPSTTSADSPLLMSSFMHSLPCATSSTNNNNSSACGTVNEQQQQQQQQHNNLAASLKLNPFNTMIPMEMLMVQHHHQQQQRVVLSGSSGLGSCLNINSPLPSEYNESVISSNNSSYLIPSNNNNSGSTSFNPTIHQNSITPFLSSNIEIPFDKINMSNNNNNNNNSTSYLPFPSLVNLGVQQETVRQLIEMKAYLSKYFDLELLIRSKVSENNNLQSNLDSNFTANKIIAARKLSHPHDLCFTIPISCAGKIIGKRGILLKDLQSEFPGIRIYIQKEEYNGCRIVVLSYIANNSIGGGQLQPTSSPSQTSSPQVTVVSDTTKSVMYATITNTTNTTQKEKEGDDYNNLLVNEKEESSTLLINSTSQDESCTTNTTTTTTVVETAVEPITTVTTKKTININTPPPLKSTSEIEVFLLQCKERIMFMIGSDSKQLSNSDNLLPPSSPMKESSTNSPTKLM